MPALLSTASLRLESLSENSTLASAESRRSAPVPGRRNVRRSAGMERFRDRGLSHPSAPEDGRTPSPHFQTRSQPERCSRKSRTEVCRAGRTALPACPRVHQREHQTVWPNERSFSSAHRLAGRDRQDACPTFYCIVPAESLSENSFFCVDRAEAECARPRAQQRPNAGRPPGCQDRGPAPPLCARGRAHSACAFSDRLSAGTMQ